MTLTQNLLNASAFARSAATATNTRMSETQARRVLADIKRANKRPVLLGYDPAITGGGYVNWRSG